ncbi:MAG: hypothetical protein KGM98_07590 [Bacteroidota bacterium]|nr:hypothetical protein [Bacteroidota bacterium]
MYTLLFLGLVIMLIHHLLFDAFNGVHRTESNLPRNGNTLYFGVSSFLSSSESASSGYR